MEAQGHTVEYFKGQVFSARMFGLSAAKAASEAAELRREGYIVRVLDNDGRDVSAPEKRGKRRG